MSSRTVVGLVGDLVVVRKPISSTDRVPFNLPIEVPMEIVGFETLHHGRLSSYGSSPGLYLNPAYPRVSHAGAEHVLYESHLEPAPGRTRRPYDADAFRIGDLPETAFWELDVVAHPEIGLMRVRNVEYDDVGRMRNDGVTPMPIYTCDIPRSGSSFFEEGHLSLHRRGNVWRHAQGETPVFGSLDEAAKFHVAVGGRTTLKAPDGTYSFSPDEAIEALATGIADCAYDGVAVFGEARSGYQLVKLADKAVGDACRDHSLEMLELTVSASNRYSEAYRR